MNTYSRRRSSPIPLLVALVLPLGATGCVHELAAEIPRAAIPGVVDGSLKAMDDPETQRRLAHLLASPEMKVIQRELVAGILDGSLAALGEQQRVDRVGEITARYAASLMHGFTRDVAPQIAPATSAAMRGMMSATMSDENQRQMGRLVGTLVQASVDPIVKSVSQADFSSAASTAMTKDLGPAVEKVLRDNLGPGLAQVLSNDEVKRALGETAHTLGREMILGANEGLARVQENKSSDDSSLLGSVSSLAHQGATASKLIPWALAAVAPLLTGWIVKLLSQTRRYRSEGEQRAETTRVLTEAIRTAEGKPWSGELLTALEDRFRNDEEALLRIQASRLRHAPPRRSNSFHGAH